MRWRNAAGARPLLRTSTNLTALAGLLLAAAAGAPHAGEAALEEITVTAQRVSERLQDVPIAVTALSGSDLLERGVRQAGDITAAVPNLLLNSPYGPEAQPTFTLRGVTTQDFSENQSSPVAMYVDEVYKPVGAVQALQIYDLDRVEVLRGPQGTLYGKNATGGAVNFYTRNPSLTGYDGYVTAGAGNYNAWSVRAAAGGPLVDNELGWRAALLYDKRDGWVRSVVPGVEPLNGVDALAGRFTLLAKPADTLTATLKLAFSRSGGTPYGAHALNYDANGLGVPYIGWFDNGAKYAVHKDIRNDSAALKLDWALAAHLTLTSVTGFDYGRWYEKSDDGGLPITARLDDPNTYFSSVNAFSQEIRLTSHDTGPFNWLAGLYYGRESTHATVQFHFFDGYLGCASAGPVPPPGTPISCWAPADPAIPTLFGFDEYNSFDQLKDSRAAFLNLTLHVTPALTLRGGLRYTRDKVTISHFYALEGGLPSPGSVGLSPDIDAATWWTQTIGNPALYSPPNSTAPRSVFQQGLAVQGLGFVPEFANTTSNFSGKAGIDWKVSEQVLAYLSLSQGYRGVAFNGQAYNDNSELTFAAPEKLTSLELGAKAEFWNHRAVLNTALFHYDYKNQQFLDAFALPGGLGTGFRTVNAPKSRVDGAEFELRLKATDDLEIQSSLGLMHSKYVDLTLHAGENQAPGVPRVCCVGNKLIQAPDYSAMLGIDWRLLHLAAGDLRLFADGNYYGKQYFDAFNTERIAQGAYGVANARLSFESPGTRGFGVGVWVRNLTNRQYLAYGLNQNDLDTGILGFDYALVGEPRTYGIDATLRF
ncbi:MAG: TonB-dependent receptor [Proteobacteria bacterium]|nr:TonB-dependent receptor [Pseudomonadota bacterium]